MPLRAILQASAARRSFRLTTILGSSLGEGTVGREIAEDFTALGIVPDIVSAPASGGGLMAGIALATKAKFRCRSDDCRALRFR